MSFITSAVSGEVSTNGDAGAASPLPTNQNAPDGGSTNPSAADAAMLLSHWSLLPDSHRDPAPPSLQYGAMHLLRLIGTFIRFLFMVSQVL